MRFLFSFFKKIRGKIAAAAASRPDFNQAGLVGAGVLQRTPGPAQAKVIAAGAAAAAVTVTTMLYWQVTTYNFAMSYPSTYVGGYLYAEWESGTWPGDDMTKTPGDGWEWRSKNPESKPGDKDGNWYNPNNGQTLRPDLNHPPPKDPHWDWNVPGKGKFEIYKDGRVIPKK